MLPLLLLASLAGTSSVCGPPTESLQPSGSEERAGAYTRSPESIWHEFGLALEKRMTELGVPDEDRPLLRKMCRAYAVEWLKKKA